MKQLTKILVFAIVLVSIGIVGCKKEIIQPETENQNTQHKLLQNQYLSFNSLKEFLDVQKLDLKEIKNQYPWFKSMQDIIDEIDTAKGECYSNLLQQYSDILYFDRDNIPHLKLMDNDLCKVLSPIGLVKIGNQFFYIDKNYTKIENESTFNIEELKEATKTTNKISIYKNKNNLKVTFKKDFYDKSFKHKLYVKKFYRNYGLWSNLGVDATHYEKTRKNKWVRDKTTISATVSWTSFSYELYWPDAPVQYVGEGAGSKSKTRRTKSLHLTKTTWWYVGTNEPSVHSYSVKGLKVYVSTYTGISGSF